MFVCLSLVRPNPDVTGFSCQLDTGKTVSVGIVYTALHGGKVCEDCLKVIDVGRPSSLWAASFPRQGVLNYITAEKLCLAQVNTPTFLSL